MTPAEALAKLEAMGDAGKAAEMAAYHKAPRRYLGVPNPSLDLMARDWRRALPLPDRLALAEGLWADDSHEGRVLAAKLLTQARIRPDDTAAWRLIASWVPDFDAWAIADHACMAGQRRLTADPVRLDEVEGWTTSPHLWTRRAALVITLPWTKQNHPTEKERATRDRILGWAAGYADDPAWFIQKAIAWWLRELSKHDPDRVRTWVAEHGIRLKPFALREATRKLS
ncbi:MAG: DNA alkylation repair protein [Shimia sp.]